jgi:hypothetical protein
MTGKVREICLPWLSIRQTWPRGTLGIEKFADLSSDEKGKSRVPTLKSKFCGEAKFDLKCDMQDPAIDSSTLALQQAGRQWSRRGLHPIMASTPCFHKGTAARTLNYVYNLCKAVALAPAILLLARNATSH